MKNNIPNKEENPEIKQLFRSFLDWIIFIFQICFDALPEVQPKPTIFFDSHFEHDTKTVKLAAINFELKKRGANESGI